MFFKFVFNFSILALRTSGKLNDMCVRGSSILGLGFFDFVLKCSIPPVLFEWDFAWNNETYFVDLVDQNDIFNHAGNEYGNIGCHENR